MDVNVRGKGIRSVPCGRCPNCLARRASGWSFRLMQQVKYSNSAEFLTLTYDNDHIPITRNGFMTLKTRDIQLFFKRLRKAHEKIQSPAGRPLLPIKYYVAGEYGSRFMRPHYHVILINADISLIDQSWSNENGESRGLVHFDGHVSEASVGYTLKYMCKTSRIPLHRNDDRLPERGYMSKGLGLSYLTNQMVSWHYADLYNRMYLNLPGGGKCGMPRYYKQKLYTPEEQEEIGIRAMNKMEEELLEKLRVDPEYYRNEAERVKMLYRSMENKARSRKF